MESYHMLWYSNVYKDAINVFYISRDQLLFIILIKIANAKCVNFELDYGACKFDKLICIYLKYYCIVQCAIKKNWFTHKLRLHYYNYYN